MSPNAGAVVQTRGFFLVLVGWGVRTRRQERLTSRGARHGGSDTVATGFRYQSRSPGASDPACCSPAGVAKMGFKIGFITARSITAGFVSFLFLYTLSQWTFSN